MNKTGGSGGKGHTSKHAGTHKHHAHGAKHHPKHQPAHHHAAHHHNVHTKAKHPHHARGLALGDALPVCTLEAVAQSLRLAGQPVGDDEVAWLWELSGSRELSIPEALEAAARFGLAGWKPQYVPHVGRRHQERPEGGRQRPPLAQAEGGRRLGGWNEPYAIPHLAGHLDEPAHDVVGHGPDFLGAEVHALILGVDIPGPHAVLATPDGWWSWGELWTPWTTAVSEAWAVSWT